MRGLLALEPSFERRAKYVEFVDIYGGLDDNERKLFEERYPREGEQMVGIIERARQEGRQEGRQEAVGVVERAREEGRQEGRQAGLREGEAVLLHRLLRERFGKLPEWVWPRLQQADTAQLERWSERILSAENLDTLFSGE